VYVALTKQNEQDGLRVHRTGAIAFGTKPLDSMSVKIRDRNYGPDRSANKALARYLQLSQTPSLAHPLAPL
jgi:hypothetical protein